MARPKLVAERDWGGTPPGAAKSRVNVPILDIEEASSVTAGLVQVLSVRAPSSPHRMQRVVPAERVELIRRAVGSSVLEDQAKLEAMVDAMDAIADLTERIQKTGVQIGREIKSMLRALSEEEGRRALRAAAELFPGWSPGNVVKMIGAAEVYDSGWVDRQILPVSYSVLYELSRLDKASMRRAVERQLISPALTRIQAGEVRVLVGMPVAPNEIAAESPKSAELFEVEAEIAAARRELKRLVNRRSTMIARERREERGIAARKAAK